MCECVSGGSNGVRVGGCILYASVWWGAGAGGGGKDVEDDRERGSWSGWGNVWRERTTQRLR